MCSFVFRLPINQLNWTDFDVKFTFMNRVLFKKTILYSKKNKH